MRARSLRRRMRTCPKKWPRFRGHFWSVVVVVVMTAMVLDDHDLLVVMAMHVAVMVALAFLDDDLAFVGACRRGQRHGNADGRQGGNRDSNLTHGGFPP